MIPWETGAGEIKKGARRNFSLKIADQEVSDSLDEAKKFACPFKFMVRFIKGALRANLWVKSDR